MKFKKDKKLNFIVITKTVSEQEPYDNHSNGIAIECIPEILSSDICVENEIEVPEYYFNQMLYMGKVRTVGMFIVADFKYDPEYGAIFEEKIKGNDFVDDDVEF